ncbi:MAG TPA: glutamate--tRNA ligase, partial [Candidatus Lokiarchaeia archaeon]
ILDRIVKEISEMELEEQKKRLLELDPMALEAKKSVEEKKELPELHNVDKIHKVIMRLAPYPSGALHIGNARMIVLNNEYIKKYNGELILFYDDTIGSPKALRDDPKSKFVLPEAYDLIKEGLDWLGVKYSKVYYKSDRLEIYYEYCEKLIKEKLAYVCFCKADEFKDNYKNKRKDCPHRDQSVDVNLEEWNNMLDGKYKETEAVVRLKTGMNQKDPALRDQIIMRISEAEHPRVGTKYLIWPMLEFSWAIDDHLLGITHILRGADLIKEDLIENFVWEIFNWKKAEFIHYGKINFAETKLSKTLVRTNIQKGILLGWDDPRTWSLQSLERRGIRSEALTQALLDLGLSMSGINFSVDWLYAKNKALIDENSDRYFYVENPIELSIINVPSKEYVAKPLLLPINPDKGTRKIKVLTENQTMRLLISKQDADNLKVNDIVRVKDLLNFKVENINLDEKIVLAEFHSKEMVREYSIIHWVPKSENINVKILKPDGSISSGLGEINLLKIPMNKPIQFERFGFVNPLKLTNNGLFCYFTH